MRTGFTFSILNMCAVDMVRATPLHFDLHMYWKIPMVQKIKSKIANEFSRKIYDKNRDA